MSITCCPHPPHPRPEHRRSPVLALSLAALVLAAAAGCVALPVKAHPAGEPSPLLELHDGQHGGQHGSGSGGGSGGGHGAQPTDRPGGAEVHIAPMDPRPGAEVTIRVHGCPGRGGTAHSEAFVHQARLSPGAAGELTGKARISSSVRPGVYPVDISCDGGAKEPRGRIVITGHDSGTAGHHELPGGHEKPGKHQEQPGKGWPSAPVRAGGGGAAGNPGAPH
ncbi:hypothetical protein [Streptomyces aidingensis]|uniref:Uncharacterized protein n=1 Tax=Streptomyces aidingensis TaxID=910347 RepID=A0A1I1RFZ2_9ACTN|nr:hypothetical protein [Streptomyces aidingensis]SFD33264.1 hypothetical protein SAMN05421773_11375 [Streptomyces aidingensis]